MTIYEYDASGRITKATDGVFVWSYEYDTNGNLIHHKGPSTEFTKSYDSQNREILYVCGSRKVKTEYDDDWNATQTEISV